MHPSLLHMSRGGIQASSSFSCVYEILAGQETEEFDVEDYGDLGRKTQCLTRPSVVLNRCGIGLCELGNLGSTHVSKYSPWRGQARPDQTPRDGANLAICFVVECTSDCRSSPWRCASPFPVAMALTASAFPLMATEWCGVPAIPRCAAGISDLSLEVCLSSLCAAAVTTATG